jgi:hypothetical protein
VIEDNKRGIGGCYGPHNFVEFALADEARGVRLLAALDERSGNCGARRSGEFLELSAAGVEVESGICGAGNVFLFLDPSRDNSGRAARKSSRLAKLLALAQLSRELDHDQDGKFLLRLRGAEFTGEECCVLRLTRFDQTPADYLPAIAPWLRGSVFKRWFLLRH